MLAKKVYVNKLSHEEVDGFIQKGLEQTELIDERRRERNEWSKVGTRTNRHELVKNHREQHGSVKEFKQTVKLTETIWQADSIVKHYQNGELHREEVINPREITRIIEQ